MTAPRPLLLAIAGLLALASGLAAHDPGLSTARIEVRDDRIELFMTLAAVDVADVLDALIASGRLPPDADLREQPEVFASAVGWLFLRGKPLAATTIDILPPSEPGEYFVQVAFDLPRKAQVEYRASCFEHLPRGHRQLAYANQGMKSLAEAILDAKNARLAFAIE